ncbi:hypothetical protein JAAARDRAFT_132477 [Jaapia argillacea MUCL 33604]|uniref:Uncharacterized protein n=1 Tax=Jaapia argillacea MUCL 33604 TaxID=933084 RepID=A0A067Q0V0_9AGAM|nr:hypothetical protein JAAARDRAFT_132477 [Jaapia argillacea MUCL 33604]
MFSLRFTSRIKPNVSLAFGLGGLFLRTPVRQSSSGSFILRQPSNLAPREVPTPLVFLSARSWDEKSAVGMTAFASIFAEKGYTCLEIDLSKPKDGVSSSESMMLTWQDELRHHIRLTSIPFAPVIVARAAGALIAQTYISSNPATGLVLISPPSSNSALPRSLLPNALEEFNYEAKFPIALVGTMEEVGMLRSSHRLGSDPGVDLIEVDEIDGQQGFSKIEQWLDEIGI